MDIGPYKLANNLILAPMAGITDLPYRQLCRQQGAGMAVSEMVASNPALRNHRRTLLKADHSGEQEPRSVQIVGTDPLQMAQAALFNQNRGAQIIDINMGCPAKKVCSVAAGSALLKNEKLVKEILETVTETVNIPVTLKIRTGWDLQHRNAVSIAEIAENAGISALTVHGRTRACAFSGHAEYQTIKQVKQATSIPVIANGDIDSPEKAQHVLKVTGADALMIGRAAQGRPWIFSEINHYLKFGHRLPSPSPEEIKAIVVEHLENLYQFYGDQQGVRIARKHIGWYFDFLGGIPKLIKSPINQATMPKLQLQLVIGAMDHFIQNRAA